MSNLRVLFVTPEAYPLVKTGGLGDVSAALPAALRQLGVDVRLLLPGYPDVLDTVRPAYTDLTLALLPGVEAAQLRVGLMPDGETPLYVLDCPQLYARPGTAYHDSEGKEWADNNLRFGALSKAAALLGKAEIAQHLDFRPDIIHCNDWQTALVPAYQRYMPGVHPYTLLSLHNMAFQGVFGAQSVPALGLPWESFSLYGLEYYGLMSFLKGGLYYADWISTVSPTYAEEIQTAEFGYGLQGLLLQRHNQLTGILNGIDTQHWNPSADPHLVAPYSIDDLSGKRQNKINLQARLGLQANPNLPLLGMISRLTQQKGIDLLLPVLQDMIAEGAQIAILGSGDKTFEKALCKIAETLPGMVSVTLGYDESLAHQIEAGADIFLMPSRFEPCGLNQMYSMRYGTVPIVRRTGGLADTVVDTTPLTLDAGTATGLVFEHTDPATLLKTVQQALLLYRYPDTWQQLQRNGMQRDFGWSQSARQYLALYQQFLD